MNALSLPVVHPAFQILKRSGRLLHLVAGGLILTHALTHIHHPHPVYFWCQLVIALDIFILVFAFRGSLNELPRVNLFFRVVEFIFFLGIGALLLWSRNWTMGGFHMTLGIAYLYLFYCERKLPAEERIGIHHTGVTIPSLPDSKFFIWSNVNDIKAGYDSITIDISPGKSYHFDLQKNLVFEELEQIHEFCRHYLGKF